MDFRNAMLALALIASQPNEADLARCSLTVTFGSYSGGTDYKAEQRVREYLKGSRQLRILKEIGWGIEGEHTLCLAARSDREADQAFNAIRDLIPAESREAWTEVKRRGGPAYRTRWPP